MKKLFVLLALGISTSAGAFNDATKEKSGESSFQSQKAIEMNVLAQGFDTISDYDRALSQPNTIA